MAQNTPPPSPIRIVPPGSGPLDHAESTYESGPERAARLAREAAETARAADSHPSPALVPGADSPPGVGVIRPVDRRAPRIAPQPTARVEPVPLPPVSAAYTLDGPGPLSIDGVALEPVPEEAVLVPEASPALSVDVARKGPVTKIVISSLRGATEADKAWALPERVGTTVPAVFVDGEGWIRYSSVISVMVESVQVDIRTGDRILFVLVVFSPDPGHGLVKNKLRSGGRVLERELISAIAEAFCGPTPVGKVLRFVAGSPTMTDAEAERAGYTARKVDPDGKKRAPLRAEFSMKEVKRREQAVRALYGSMQRDYSQFRISLVLFWWWCIGLLLPFYRARLAAYRTGERFSRPKASSKQPPKPAVSSLRENAALINAAEIAKNVAASHSSLVWMVPDLRAALVERGVKVQEIAGTRLGTMIDDGEEEPR